MTGKIREFIESKELLLNLVRRDLNVKHRNSFLGFLWSFLNPLMMLIIYTFVFAYLLKIALPTSKYPFSLFLFCGLVPWNLFANSIGSSVGSITGNGYLIKKIYFPREILPISMVISNFVYFLFELGVLLVFMTALRVFPSWTSVFFFLVLAIELVMIVGLSLIFATLNVYFRDVEHLTTIILQLWFWLTPIVYPIQMVTERTLTQRFPIIYKLFMLNPMAVFVTSYRSVLLDGTLPSFAWLGVAFLISVFLLVVGLIVFNKYERFFAEEV